MHRAPEPQPYTGLVRECTKCPRKSARRTCPGQTRTGIRICPTNLRPKRPGFRPAAGAYYTLPMDDATRERVAQLDVQISAAQDKIKALDVETARAEADAAALAAQRAELEVIAARRAQREAESAARRPADRA